MEVESQEVGRVSPVKKKLRRSTVPPPGPIGPGVTTGVTVTVAVQVAGEPAASEDVSVHEGVCVPAWL